MEAVDVGLGDVSGWDLDDLVLLQRWQTIRVDTHFGRLGLWHGLIAWSVLCRYSSWLATRATTCHYEDKQGDHVSSFAEILSSAEILV